MEHTEYNYRIWDLSLGGWMSRYDYRSHADALWQLDYMAAQGADITHLEIREQEIVWKSMADVSVPLEEEMIR